MRKMKDSGVEWIGKIPEDWDIVPIKYLVSYNDETLSENTKADYEFEYIDIGSVEYGKGITKREKMKFRASPSRARRIVEKDDVILSTVRTYLKAVARVPDSDIPLIVSTGFVVLRAKKSKVNPLYLNYSVLSHSFVSEVEAKSVGISYPAINSSDVVCIPIALPSLDKQREVSKRLDRKCIAVDSIIEKTHASIEEYKRLRQAVITQTVTKGVRGDRAMKNTGVEWIGNCPEDWEVHRIANLYDERSENGEADLPILQVSINTGISDHEIADEDLDRVFVRSEDRTKYKRVYPGDLAYNMMRAWQGAFGAVRVDGMISPAYVVAKPKDEVQIDSRYMEALLRTPEAIEEMHRYSRGIADFRLRLYWPEFKNIRVCFPSYEEQVEIADYIDEKTSAIDRLIQKKEQYLVELETMKKSLIYEYVTSKKEV